MNKANLLLSLPLVAAATDAAYAAERHNLAAEHPEMLKELIGKWDEWAATHFVLPKRAPK